MVWAAEVLSSALHALALTFELLNPGQGSTLGEMKGVRRSYFMLLGAPCSLEDSQTFGLDSNHLTWRICAQFL